MQICNDERNSFPWPTAAGYTPTYLNKSNLKQTTIDAQEKGDEIGNEDRRKARPQNERP